ncbi:MAG TPA: 4a-hydroxytetrahydrobiopterin dehydratase [Gammaproteobacteria bacterium]|nr:4a-hydroxytetrahydrobiopterin dehydratase [Gammaproteobacteria bacterium]
MSDLTQKHCKACEGGVPALTREEIAKLHPKIPSWEVSDDAKWLKREFKFKDFHQTMDFVNKLAEMSHEENHHADLHVGYNYCKVEYTTHALNGLSENDFICAAKVDRL